MSRSRDLSNIGPGVQTSFRNKVINGDMRVNQRGTYSTTTNTHQYTTDRWWVFSGVSTVGAPSYVSSTGLTNFPFALRAQRQAANTGTSAIVAGQTFESANVYGLQGQIITVSFWARAGANFSSAANALGVYFGQGTGIDQGTATIINQTWTGVSVTGIGTATLTTSWQKFSYSYAVPATATELALEFVYTATGTAGANDYFDITGVQVELGSTATPFEHRPYGTELALCQRYYQNIVVPAGTTDFNWPVVRESTTQAQATVFLPATLRSAPAVVGTTLGRVVGRDTAFGVTSASVTGISLNAGGPSLNAVTLVIGHGAIAGSYVYFEWDLLNTTANLALNSEL
jgi:hypothetical protein